MRYSQKVIENSIVLQEMKESHCLLNEHDTYLLNYVAELSPDKLNVFIKASSNEYLIKLFNLCDYLDIQYLMSISGKELATRMNHMNKDSLETLINNEYRA